MLNLLIVWNVMFQIVKVVLMLQISVQYVYHIIIMIKLKFPASLANNLIAKFVIQLHSVNNALLDL